MREDEKKIIKIYSKETVAYYKKARVNSFLNDCVVNPVFRAKAISLGVLKNKTLDLGCGYGSDLEYFTNKKAKKLTGIDISQACVNAVLNNKKLTANNVQIFKRSVYKIYFKDEFKIVISNMVFDQIKNLEIAFKNVALSLKNNGDFLFSMAHPINISTNDYTKPLYNYFENGIGTFKPKTLNKNLFYYKRNFEKLSKALLQNDFLIAEILEPKPIEKTNLKYPIKAKKYSRLPSALIIHARKIIK